MRCLRRDERVQLTGALGQLKGFGGSGVGNVAVDIACEALPDHSTDATGSAMFGAPTRIAPFRRRDSGPSKTFERPYVTDRSTERYALARNRSHRTVSQLLEIAKLFFCAR